MKTWLESGLWHSFRDVQATITRTAAAGDIVFVETNMRGTFERVTTNTLAGRTIAPTHEEETWTWLFVFRFEDGKIAEEWWYVDWPWETRYVQ